MIENASAADVAWAAGLFEGEGWITWSTRRPGNRSHVHLGMSSTDEDVIRKFAALVGGTVSGPLPTRSTLNAKPHWNFKPHWNWILSRHDEVGTVLGFFLPWLGERRREKVRQAFVVSHDQAFSHKGPPRHRWTLVAGQLEGGAT